MAVNRLGENTYLTTSYGQVKEALSHFCQQVGLLEEPEICTFDKIPVHKSYEHLLTPYSVEMYHHNKHLNCIMTVSLNSDPYAGYKPVLQVFLQPMNSKEHVPPLHVPPLHVPPLTAVFLLTEQNDLAWAVAKFKQYKGIRNDCKVYQEVASYTAVNKPLTGGVTLSYIKNINAILVNPT